MKYRACGLLIMLIAIYPAHAQYTDSSHAKVTMPDSLLKPAVSWNTVVNKKSFAFRGYLLPVTLIAYGIVSLHTDALQDVNETIKEELYTERQPQKTTLDNYLQYAPAAAVYVLNATGIHGSNNFRDLSMIYGISNLLLGTTVFAVKHISKEARPDGSNNLSFPSGHTATAFASAAFLWKEYKDLSPWYGIAGYAAAAATGYLRLSNNKHWMGDIAAGAGVGVISTKMAYWMYPAIKRKLFSGKEVGTVIMPTYQNGSWGLGLVKQL